MTSHKAVVSHPENHFLMTFWDAQLAHLFPSGQLKMAHFVVDEERLQRNHSKMTCSRTCWLVIQESAHEVPVGCAGNQWQAVHRRQDLAGEQGKRPNPPLNLGSNMCIRHSLEDLQERLHIVAQ
ncbi:unnamed protein product [Merluccius merluccius]